MKFSACPAQHPTYPFKLFDKIPGHKLLCPESVKRNILDLYMDMDRVAAVVRLNEPYIRLILTSVSWDIMFNCTTSPSTTKFKKRKKERKKGKEKQKDEKEKPSSTLRRTSPARCNACMALCMMMFKKKKKSTLYPSVRLSTVLRDCSRDKKCGLLGQVVFQHRWHTEKSAHLGVWKVGLLAQVAFKHRWS